ncbi:hypothetical protein [Microbacterium lacusdiani]
MLIGGVAVLGTAALYPAVAPLLEDSRPRPPQPTTSPDSELMVPGVGFSIAAEAGGGGAVVLRAGDGTPLQRFGGYRVGEVIGTSGSVSITRGEDGASALTVDYEVAGSATLRGTFTPRGRRLEIQFDVSSPGLESSATALMRREPAAGGATEEVAYGVAAWRRDPRGGIPFEDETDLVYVQHVAGRALAIVAREGNADWRSGSELSLPGERLSAGVFRARSVVLIGDAPHPAVYAAAAFGKPLAAGVWTDRPFNIWDRADRPLVVHGVAHNEGPERAITFRWLAHDFDGRVVADRRRTVVADEGSTATDDVEVRLPGRGIAFVELTVSAGADRDLVRTNVAVLPPHRFVEGATSMFGTAAGHLFDLPEERTLLKRIGVRKVRRLVYPSGEAARLGFTQSHLTIPETPGQFDGDDAALQAYAAKVIDEAEAGGATHYECANEWNMLGDGILSGDGARRYVEKWLTAFRRELDRRSSTVRLLAQGLAGMDLAYAEGMYDAGLAKYAHAFNLHPGRANVTPDYAPPPADWTRGEGVYWNFLGALKEARRLIEQRAGGALELWLTEAYAVTKPNSWWSDTYRHAAENVVLSAAIAKAHDVTALLWYQLYDGLYADLHRADPGNREYHFGLMLRDRSPKPSLLAFANIAEQLDQSSFRRWLDFRGTARRGMVFDTPRGLLTLLWTRADGYILNTEGARDGDFFPSPEPWEDTWRTRDEVTVPASGAVTRIDVIGRRSAVPVKDGEVRIALDGAPSMYYGLDVPRLEAALTR